MKDSYGQPINNNSWVEQVESNVTGLYILIAGVKKQYVLDHHEMSTRLRLNSSVFKMSTEKRAYLEQLRKDGKVVQICE